MGRSMQSKLSDSTLRLYKNLIVLASAGFKLKLESIAVSHDMEPMLMIGYPDIITSYEFNFSFYLHEEVFINPYTGQKEYPQSIIIEITTYDLHIDWEYLNDNVFGYELFNHEEWNSKITKELKD